MPDQSNILIVENEEKKFSDVLEVVESYIENKGIQPSLTRAINIIEAEDFLDEKRWNLVLLDISMNITEAASENFDGNQADLAGLELAETMHLLDMVSPTIIITGFDYFRITDQNKPMNSYLDLNELKQSVSRYLGDYVVATIKYGDPSWREELSDALEVWRQKYN